MREYDQFCQVNLPEKIPSWFNKDWRRRMGDCIYNFSNKDQPTLRKGVHSQSNMERDLSGNNALISNEFYYFGEEPRIIPQRLKRIIKTNQGHLRIDDPGLLNDFEKWINQFKKNTLYAEPQLKFEFKLGPSDEQISKCSVRHKEKEKDETEETLC